MYVWVCGVWCVYVYGTTACVVYGCLYVCMYVTQGGVTTASDWRPKNATKITTTGNGGMMIAVVIVVGTEVVEVVVVVVRDQVELVATRIICGVCMHGCVWRMGLCM